MPSEYSMGENDVERGGRENSKRREMAGIRKKYSTG